MHYTENSNKSVQEVVDTIQEKISDYKFGVLHIHNVKETLKSKGVEFDRECQILDICNPNHAKNFLEENMALSVVMPCKITVYSEDNQTKISMNSLVQLVDDIHPEFIDKAEDIQETLLDLIDDVK